MLARQQIQSQGGESVEITVEVTSLGIVKAGIDRFLISMVLGVLRRRLRGKDRSAVIEYQSKLDGPNGVNLL